MKLNKYLTIILIAIASFGAASVSLAEQKAKKPAVAIDDTLAKLQVALDAVGKGNGEELAVLIKEASNEAQELYSSYKVEFERDRAIIKLKSARKHAKESALPEAEKELKEVIKTFNDLKGMI